MSIVTGPPAAGTDIQMGFVPKIACLAPTQHHAFYSWLQNSRKKGVFFKFKSGTFCDRVNEKNTSEDRQSNQTFLEQQQHGVYCDVVRTCWGNKLG
jgi:hypothetical protein